MKGRIAALLSQFPGRILAQDDSGSTIYYDTALDSGNALLHGLPERRSLVFLLMQNTTRTLAAYLALLDIGYPVLLLDAAINPVLLDRLIENYQPDAIVTPDAPVPVHAMPGTAAGNLHPDLAILLSTSGSTGSPKLARFTCDAALSNAQSIASYLGLSQDDRPFAHLPMHYSFGYSIINSHLVAGACIQLTSYSLMQREFWEQFRKTRATSFSGVPFHYEMLRRLGFARIDAPSLRTMTQAGGRLSPDLIRHFAAETSIRGIKFFVMYGQTEAGPRMSYLPPEDATIQASSIGKAIPGVNLYLRRDDGSIIVDPNAEGELICQSPAVMMGYANNRSDLALGDTQGGVLATGDLARRNVAGYFEITGRSSRFIKVMGTRVSLDDAEDAAKQLGYVAAAVGAEDKLVIVVEGMQDVQAVRSSLVEALMVSPRALHVMMMPELPRASSGKILYAQLNRMLQDGTI
jgi:long-chain acyl-CoA synthetase